MALNTITTFHPRNDRDWRCTCCFKLLGKRSNAHVQVRNSKGHRYIMSTPVTAVCRCGTLNELRG